MIKKFSAFSFILLANIILLAHAVIPHHHHDSVICIKQNHCQDDRIPYNHNVTEHNHQHDGNKNSTSCILKQSVVVPTSQGRQLKSCDNYSGNHNPDYYTQSHFGISDLQADSKVVAYYPVQAFYLLLFVTSALGLRAPPLS